MISDRLESLKIAGRSPTPSQQGRMRIPKVNLRQALQVTSNKRNRGFNLDIDKLEVALRPLHPFFIPLERLAFEEDIDVARGGYGLIRVAELLSNQPGVQNVKVAVKELFQGDEPLRIAYRLTREMLVWSKLRHPNVLPFIGYHLDLQGLVAYLISPFMEIGNIKDYLESQRPTYRHRAILVQDTIDGLCYLHLDKGIIHGDLKSLNVLISPERRAMLCDFGLATVAEEDSGLSTSKGFHGSIRWSAPEVINETQRSFQSDMWSWGCLAFEIVTDLLPYHAYTNITALHRASQGERPTNIEAFEGGLCGPVGLLDLCWSLDPAKRPSAMQAHAAWSRCRNEERWDNRYLTALPNRVPSESSSDRAGSLSSTVYFTAQDTTPQSSVGLVASGNGSHPPTLDLVFNTYPGMSRSNYPFQSLASPLPLQSSISTWEEDYQNALAVQQALAAKIAELEWAQQQQEQQSEVVTRPEPAVYGQGGDALSLYQTTLAEQQALAHRIVELEQLQLRQGTANTGQPISNDLARQSW